MATGWAGDGAVQDQIDATIKDAIARARSKAPQGPSRSHCEECDAPIPPARRKAVPGVRLCVACQQAHDDEASTFTGYNRRGFRAPGYTLSSTLLEVLRERGYAYDSSLLPSPPYYAAKAGMLGLYALLGRASRSILGAPGQLFSPRGPHRRSGVRELPVATLPLTRFPAIGTTLLAAPWLARGGFAAGHFNLELHGIDALDQTDVPEEIARAQPGLRRPAREKLRRLRGLLRSLPGESCTLEQAAVRFLP